MMSSQWATELTHFTFSYSACCLSGLSYSDSSENLNVKSEFRLNFRGLKFEGQQNSSSDTYFNIFFYIEHANTPEMNPVHVHWTHTHILQAWSSGLQGLGCLGSTWVFRCLAQGQLSSNPGSELARHQPPALFHIVVYTKGTSLPSYRRPISDSWSVLVCQILLVS